MKCACQRISDLNRLRSIDESSDERITKILENPSHAKNLQGLPVEFAQNRICEMDFQVCSYKKWTLVPKACTVANFVIYHVKSY